MIIYYGIRFISMGGSYLILQSLMTSKIGSEFMFTISGYLFIAMIIADFIGQVSTLASQYIKENGDIYE